MFEVGRRIVGSRRKLNSIIGFGMIGLFGSAAPAASADPVAPDQQFVADVMSYMVPPWPADQTVQLGQQACAEITAGASADNARNALLKDLENQGVRASNADVGTLVRLAVKDLCPQLPYR